MTAEPDSAEGTSSVVATTNLRLSRAEFELLLRLRNLRNQASDGIIRIELNVTKTRVEMIDARPIKREVFAF